MKFPLPHLVLCTAASLIPKSLTSPTNGTDVSRVPQVVSDKLVRLTRYSSAAYQPTYRWPLGNMLVDGNNMCLQFVHGNKGFVARDDVHEESDLWL